jgi:hypothetical protein
MPDCAPYGYDFFAKEASKLVPAYHWPHLDEEGEFIFDASKPTPSALQFGLLDHDLHIPLIPAGHVAVMTQYKANAEALMQQKINADMKHQTRRANEKLRASGSNPKVNTPEMKAAMAAKAAKHKADIAARKAGATGEMETV